MQRAVRHTGRGRREVALRSCLGPTWVWIGACLLLSACGPSVQAVQEGTIRFEFCYRLDLDERATIQQRLSCWDTWLARHTYGQTHDRAQYAWERARALRSGDATRPALNVAAPPSLQAQADVTPLDPNAPPPAMAPAAPVGAAPSATALPVAGESAREGERSSASPPPPYGDCEARCRDGWGRCAPACNDGTSRACRGCRDDYSACMRRCYVR